MYSEEFSNKLNFLCKELSNNWDHRLYFKKHKSNGMCVKILFELLAKISSKHNEVHLKIKKIIWSDYLLMVTSRGLIKEFEKYGMTKVDAPEVGAFIFLKQRKVIGHVGLCINNNKFWHLCKKGFVCEEINFKNVAHIGVF